MSPKKPGKFRRFGAARPEARLLLAAAVCCLALASAAASTSDARGVQFIGFTRFSGFQKSKGSYPGEYVITSPVIRARIPWDELIASWNLGPSRGCYLEVQARAIYAGRATKYYTLGIWCGDPSLHPRRSVSNQEDADGDVLTDTLELKVPCEQFQLRLTLGDTLRRRVKLRFLGLCLTDTHAAPGRLPPNRLAWGRLLPVPERSQMPYPNGNALCSPTTVSMIMAYWSRKLHRPELDQGVPEVADKVYDSNWKGTGNWPFNTAYAGSYRRMRAYVTRLSDVSELEDWIAAGVPVGVSLDYDKLRGKAGPPSGHLVVCVGFTKDGEVVLNDPGTSHNVRKTFPRDNLTRAWAYSRNTVYLIYPQDTEIPTDRFGHWDSWTAHLLWRKGPTPED